MSEEETKNEKAVENDVVNDMEDNAEALLRDALGTIKLFGPLKLAMRFLYIFTVLMSIAVMVNNSIWRGIGLLAIGITFAMCITQLIKVLLAILLESILLNAKE